MTPHIHRWTAEEPRVVVLLAHGYGEHARRYDHVAERFVNALDAAVWAPDHRGHGLTEGDRAVVEGGGEQLTSDLHDVADAARAEHPGLPVVLVGHSMGGLIATRFAQRFGDELTALVLSGPAIGGNPAFFQLLQMDPIPDVPIDPAVLSRDPAVGEAYGADELVYHGPFARATLESLASAVERVAQGGDFGDLPTLWIHGAEDQLVPLDVTREAIVNVRGSNFTEIIYEGARHEVFNEINKDAVLDDVVGFLAGVLAGDRAATA
jgi:alpha-beta hydrolase superfamily lysophospholipase